MSSNRQRIAVIGAGVSGLTTAWLLSEKYDVELFEAGSYAGGHTNTESVRSGGRAWPVTSVVRQQDKVLVTVNDEPQKFDQVVFACHSDQALKMIQDPTAAELEVLSAITYQRNDVVLHTDGSVLPTNRRAWAAWNYFVPQHSTEPVSVTYNMNVLQNFHDAPETFCVTLNRSADIDPKRIIKRFEYSHPVFTLEAVAAQKRYDEIGGHNRSHFCGAYWFNGFHEDGVCSAAAVHKLDTICRKLDLRPGDHVMEVGTGWGGFAIYAAKHFGCHVTTTTISREQLELAKEKVKAEGLEDRITLLFDDYRDLEGQFDKLVSIEMIEAVGPQFLDSYFSQISRLLKPDGLALVQAINMPEQRYRRALKNVDFIQRFIFPGSFIPSIGAILGSVRKGSDLVMTHAEDIGFHYTRTLHDWCGRFMANREKLQAQGYDEAFRSLWHFYFAYCEAGFSERAIGVSQIVFAKPGNKRGHPGLL